MEYTNTDIIKRISAFSTKDLLKLYNDYSGRQAKKFSSRAAGEKSFYALLRSDKSAILEFSKEFMKSATVAPQSAAQEARKQEPKAAATKPKKAASSKSPEDNASSRSDSIKTSWLDKSVRMKRCQRNGCRVFKRGTPGSERLYRSVGEAFLELGLDQKKVIKFRMALKATANGKLEHEGYHFTLTTGE